MSTRDLARFGQLYLQKGRWERRRLIPADWVEESTRPHTDDGDGTGYGYMWWTYRAGSFTARYPMLGQQTFYRGLGTGEQGLWVIPGAELVVVHRADTDHGRPVESDDHWRLVESILAARVGAPESHPDLGALQPAPLSSQLPPIAIPEYRPLARSVLDRYIGDYHLPLDAGLFAGRTLTAGGTAQVFLFEEKPYVHLPGAGDVQLFPEERDTFTVRAVPGVTIAFERKGDAVTALIVTVNGHTVRATR